MKLETSPLLAQAEQVITFTFISFLDILFSVVGLPIGKGIFFLFEMVRNISYNLPAQHFLSTYESDPSKFVLTQKFGFPFEGIVAEEYVLTIIFPEGAKDIKVYKFL